MSLKKKAASGAKWTTASQVGSTIFKLVELGVLARILSASDFGLMSMVMVVIGFATAYMDMGINKAIIHRQDATKNQLSSLYWLNLTAGAIVFSIVYLVTPFVVDFYNEPRLDDLVLWASLTFLIAPFGQQFNYLLQKHLQFKLLCFITLASAFIGTSVAVVAALLDQGVYALIWGQLVKTGISTAGYMFFGYSKWPPEFHFNWKELKGYLSFGMYQLGDRTTNYFSKNIDYILIGRYLGPEILGQYTIAFQLVVIPIQKINSVLTKVAFPLFAKRQDKNSSLRYGYLQMTKILTGVVYPLLIGLAAAAPLAIPLFLGEGWELSIVLIQILMVVGLARTLGNPSGSLYLAKGRADIGFIFNLCTAVISGIVFWYFVGYGAAVIALSFAVLNIIYVLVHIQIISRLIRLSYSAYATAISIQVLLSLLMGAIIYGLYLSLVSVVEPLVLLGIQIVAGAGFYIAASMILEKKFVQEFYTLLKGDRKSSKKMISASETK